MTDLQIAADPDRLHRRLRGLPAAVRPGADDERARGPGRASPRRSSSSTCCGRCCAPRTSDRGHRRPPDARHARARDPHRHAVPRALHPPGDGGRAGLPQPDPPPVERTIYRVVRDRRDRRAGLEGLRGVRPRDGLRRDRRRLRRAPPAGRPAAQPGRHPADVARTSRSTRRSASRPTRTGRTTRARPARPT